MTMAQTKMVAVEAIRNGQMLVYFEIQQPGYADGVYVQCEQERRVNDDWKMFLPKFPEGKICH